MPYLFYAMLLISAIITWMSDLEKRTVLLNALFNFGYSLATSFVNVYLYVYADSLITMSIYTMIRIGLFPFFFILGNHITRKHSFVITYTIGIILITCSLVYALMGKALFEINGNYILIAAVITGIGEGFYWYSANASNQIISTVETRAKFLSYNGIFNNVSALLAPVIAGIIIGHSPDDMTGYRHILMLIIAVYSLVILIALSIHKRRENTSKSVLSALSLKDKQWRDHQVAIFFYGMKNSLSLTLNGILVFNAAGSGGLYSRIQILFAIITIASFRIITRFLDKKHIDATFMIGVFLTVSSTIVLVMFDNIAGAIYYGVSNALALVFYDNSYAYISANIISRYDNEMTERIVGRETAMSLGRCVGMGFIVLLSVLLPEDLYLKISVITLSLTPFIVERILIKYK